MRKKRRGRSINEGDVHQIDGTHQDSLLQQQQQQQENSIKMQRLSGYETCVPVIGAGKTDRVRPGRPLVAPLLAVMCLVLTAANLSSTSLAAPNIPSSLQQSQQQQQHQTAALQRHNQIVFPGPNGDPDHQHPSQRLWLNSSPQQHQQQRQQSHIYVNPQPSTLSGKYQMAGSEQVSSRPQQLIKQSQTGTAGYYQPPIGGRPQRQTGFASGSSSPSSIGKSEKSQVAEWPFFKSFQTIRNNQMSNQLQALPSTTIQPTTVAMETGADQRGRPDVKASQPETSTSLDEPQAGSGGLEAASATQDPQTSTSTLAPPSLSSPVNAPASDNEDESSNGTDDDQGDKVIGNKPMNSPNRVAGVMTSSTTTTTSTTTTAAPFVEETTTTMASTTTTTTTTTQPPPRGEGEHQPDLLLMAPKMHSSIQSAVNRLVEMSAAKVADKSQQTIANGSVSMAPQDANNNNQKVPNVMRLNGNSSGLRSSLSLNVLLKNFGAFNLSSLDQILLKSSLNGHSNSSKAGGAHQLPIDHGRIAINGIHQRAGGKELFGSNGRGPGSDEKAADGQNDAATQLDNNNNERLASAECKIEYTMEHVNISLINDDKSDYTCDYIIDRKLGPGQAGAVAAAAPRLAALSQKICKLQLKSDFFSNETSEPLVGQDGDDSATCSGSTYLSIGQMRFCHLQTGSGGVSLNRVFNFPIEREAFDIRLVHKTNTTKQATAPKGMEQANNDEQQNGEIHLEIKPLLEGSDNCNNQDSTSVSEAPLRPSSMPTTRGTMAQLATTPKPQTSSIRTNKPASRQDASSGLSSTTNADNNSNNQASAASAPRQSPRFVVKMAQERQQLHPLNNQNRLKQQQPSQMFDLGRLNGKNDTRSEPAAVRPASTRPVASEQVVGETPASSGRDSEPVCRSDSVHVSTIGQIQTPNYPNNYTANMRCRHVVKRVSRAHCKLLLHFRDFDLVPRETKGARVETQRQASSSSETTYEDCQGDYLQIGETRYCNKYAMIGHKMYLNFSEASTSELNDEAIALTFISDSQASGRGVLIKYQQLLCEDELSLSEGQRQVAKLANSNGRAGANLLASVNRGEPAGPNAGPTKLQTLAPPIQQPDFSLALKSLNKTSQVETADPSSSSSSSSSPRGARSKAQKSDQDKAQHHHQQSPAAQLANSARVTPNRSSAATTPSSPGSSDDRGSQSQPQSQQQQQQQPQPQMLQMASTVPSGNLLLADTPTTSASTLGATSDTSSSRACNMVNHEMQFLLTSHNYPNAYENNLACMYFVRRNSSKVCYLELTFLRFDLEADSDCRYDFLEVNNVRLCGSLQQSTTRIYLFEEAIKLIKFKTDSTGSKGGFLIKAEQLECGPDGSILRNGGGGGLSGGTGASPEAETETTGAGGGPVLATTTQSSSSKTNVSSVFEYDSILSQAKSFTTSDKAQRDNSDTPQLVQSGLQSSGLSLPSATSRSNSTRAQQRDSSIGPAIRQLGPRRFDEEQQTARQCDYLLHGRDITIRSPMWPESYTSDELLGSCRYTILRQNFGSKRSSVCQLELRFVHLRLGSGDCLDIDGMELLCGFNVRNLVKYYPFNERQTHLTITFSTASGAAKLFTGRSATPPYQHQATLMASQQQQQQQQQQNHSDLLPTVRGPLRFMIIARQLECIDDFLAPLVELDQPFSSGSPAVNTTNLLYTTNDQQRLPLPPPRPRYVNRTGSLAPPSRPLAMQPVPVPVQRGRVNESQLSYDQTPSSGTLIDLEPIRLGPSTSGGFSTSQTTTTPSPNGPRPFGGAGSSSSSSGGVLMYSFANSISSSSNGARNSSTLGGGSSGGSGTCLVQFNQYNGILASSNILRARAESGSKSNECEIRLKLLPGFCKIQLSFGEFDLYPARLGGSLCLGEYLELAGVQYCGQELRNSTRLLSTTLAGQRHISLRATQISHNSFRAIFKQLECDLPASNFQQTSQPLAASGGPSSTSSSAINSGSSTVNGGATTTETAVRESGGPQHSTKSQPGSIDFREIVLRSEFFELNSNKLSRHSTIFYDPNMFIIYKLKKAHPSVCKLRLMFYKFDLEQAQPTAAGGCKRDFLDINNQDRLCGSMDFRLEESSREYDWSTSKDFQISFVSDSLNQRTGYHLFGQQIRCNQATGQLQQQSDGGGNQMSDRSSGSNGGSNGPNAGKPATVMSQSNNDDSHNDEPPARVEAKKVGSLAASKPSSEQRQLPSNCSQIVDGDRFELASPGWPSRYEGVGACHFLIRRSSPQICSLTLNVNSMILDVNSRSQEEGLCSSLEEAQAGDHLELDQAVQLCGLITRPRSFKFNFANSTVQRQFIMVKFVSNLARGFGFLIEGQQNACDNLETLPRVESQTTNKTETTSDANEPGREGATSRDQGGDNNNNNNQNQSVYQISYDDSPKQGQRDDGEHRQPETKTGSQESMGSHQEAAPISSRPAHQASVAKPNPTSHHHQPQQQQQQQPDQMMMMTHPNDHHSSQDSPPTSHHHQPQQQQQQPDQMMMMTHPNDHHSSQDSQPTCNRLLTGPSNLIESENFPEHYANNMDCLYAVRRMNQSVCAIDLVFNYFDLEPPTAAGLQQQQADGGQSSQCENDYVEIDYSRFCGAYPSQHRLRFNYYHHELDKIVRFRSDAARTRIGFSISVSQVMGDDECNRAPSSVGESKEQSLGQQQQQQQQPPTRKEQENDREVISYLPDSTSSSSVEMSAPNNGSHPGSFATQLEQRQHQQQAGLMTTPPSGQPSSTLCQFSYRSERQLLVSPGYNAQRRHYDNNLHCHYKIIAASYDICSLRLTIIDLELEQSADCSNDYLLIDSQRYCGSLIGPAAMGSTQTQSASEQQQANRSGGSKSLELDFDANLPREIDLLFHTDSHTNSGRGFKLLAEQVACQQQPGSSSSARMGNGGASSSQPQPTTDQEFRLAGGGMSAAHDDHDESSRLDAQSVAQARQVRRMRFGQLSYPKNYVSSPTGQQQPQQQLSTSEGVARGSRARWDSSPPPTAMGNARLEDDQPASRRTESSRTGRQRDQKPNDDSDNEFKTISSDDLKLSKEIVVTRNAGSGSHNAERQAMGRAARI